MKNSVRYVFPLLLSCLSVYFARAQAIYAKGCALEGSAFYDLPRSVDLFQSPVELLPKAASLKNNCPEVLSQGVQGSCTAFATAYYARTINYAIKNNWTDLGLITKYAFSPAYIYNQIKDVGDCSIGSKIANALHKMKYEGCLPLLDFPYEDNNCNRLPSFSQRQRAGNYRIKDFRTLYDGREDLIALFKVKKSLSERNPVIISMAVYSSFEASNGIEVWNGRRDRFTDYHAIAIIGYDDNKFGGAFELINSWGADFGQKGYIWVRYSDMINIWRSAYEIIENPNAGAVDLAAKLSFELNTDFFRNIPVTRRYDGLYKTDEAYISGTRYRIYLDNNESAYVYAFASDLTGEVVTLFPLDKVSALLPYRSNRVILPGKNYFLEMNHTKGTDFLCILYCKAPLDIERIKQKVKTGTGSFSSKVKRAVGEDKIVPAERVRYNEKTAAFSARGLDKDVVVIIVEMEHR